MCCKNMCGLKVSQPKKGWEPLAVLDGWRSNWKNSFKIDCLCFYLIKINTLLLRCGRYITLQNFTRLYLVCQSRSDRFESYCLSRSNDRGSLDRISLDRITWSKFPNKIGVWSKLCFITWSKVLINHINISSLDRIFCDFSVDRKF